MTPKEKADELVKKMYKIMSDSVSDITLYFSKKCALIAVDEIINNFGLFSEGKKHYCSYNTIEYYEQVKIEIENI